MLPSRQKGSDSSLVPYLDAQDQNILSQTYLKTKTKYTKVFKNHLKMVEKCILKNLTSKTFAQMGVSNASDHDSRNDKIVNRLYTRIFRHCRYP